MGRKDPHDELAVLARVDHVMVANWTASDASTSRAEARTLLIPVRPHTRATEAGIRP
ncbi:hypothetical protein GCM10010510_66590 [Streptomyces anandii JCM 4720]|nr:hypothetical protein GCM10010510_66590 [Streptomyces anandii JCM 4720]